MGPCRSSDLVLGASDAIDALPCAGGGFRPRVVRAVSWLGAAPQQLAFFAPEAHDVHAQRARAERAERNAGDANAACGQHVAALVLARHSLADALVALDRGDIERAREVLALRLRAIAPLDAALATEAR